MRHYQIARRKNYYQGSWVADNSDKWHVDPTLYDSRQAALAVVDRLESGTYDLSNGEYARPDYKVVPADNNRINYELAF